MHSADDLNVLNSQLVFLREQANAFMRNSDQDERARGMVKVSLGAALGVFAGFDPLEGTAYMARITARLSDAQSAGELQQLSNSIFDVANSSLNGLRRRLA